MKPDAFQNSPAGRVVSAAKGEYWAYVPNPLPPRLDWTLELAADLSQADRALGELAGLGRVLPNPRILIAPFMRREAVLSSQIEGTQASLFDLYVYEAAQPPPSGQPSDVREVHNYVRALEYGLERLSALPVSLRLIRELHERLMAGTQGEHRIPGEFRRIQNWIGPPGCTLNEAAFVPPPLPEMHQALDAFERFLHADSPLPPLIRLGLIHYQFEAIHPFPNGNGRVGRLLITLLLCAWGLLPQPLLYLSAYFEAHRQDYYDHLLAVSQHGAWGPWLRFFSRGVAEQSRDAVLRAGRLQHLREQYHARFQTVRAAARLLQVVDLLFTRPILDILQVAEALGVSHQSAGRYVQALEEEGVLREITGRARNRIYQADAVLDAIAGSMEAAQEMTSTNSPTSKPGTLASQKLSEVPSYTRTAGLVKDGVEYGKHTKGHQCCIGRDWLLRLQ
jgi:Fic family protein